MEKEYQVIRDTLADEKLTRYEIGQLQSIFGIKLSDIWEDKWENTYNILNNLLENFNNIYDRINYVESVKPGIFDSINLEKLSLYFLNGVVYKNILDLSKEILDIKQTTDKGSTSEFERVLRNVFQLFGLLPELTPFYSPIIPLEEHNELFHPLKVTKTIKKYKKILKNFFYPISLS